jgi:phosphoribosylcarboxyaminoimidazole (NCAIR) mutase
MEVCLEQRPPVISVPLQTLCSFLDLDFIIQPTSNHLTLIATVTTAAKINAQIGVAQMLSKHSGRYWLKAW